MKELVNFILGNATPTMIMAYVICAYVGLIVNAVIDILQRKPESPNSPHQFDWAYWWADNKRRLLLSIILIPFIVILGNSAGSLLELSSMNITTAFLIGWSGDGISVLLKKKGFVKGVNI
jgi:hypothetical protein